YILILVNLLENTELIKHYLSVLKLRREEFIQNYQPTHWELLTPIERKKIINKNLANQQEEQIKAQLEINNFFCLHRKRKKTYLLKKMSATKITTLPNTVNIVPNQGFTTEEYNPENDHTDNRDLIDWGEGVVAAAEDMVTRKAEVDQSKQRKLSSEL
ncbi:hypothetical protein VP01_946g3, partial [Puccinia sorghi]